MDLKFIGIVIGVLLIFSCNEKEVNCEKLRFKTVNGKVYSKMMYQGKAFSGTCISRYSNGDLRYKKQFANGIPEGCFSFWYTNGNLSKEECYWGNSWTLKRIKEWDKNKAPIKELKYNDKSGNGNFTYYKNGTIKRKGIILRGLLEGDTLNLIGLDSLWRLKFETAGKDTNWTIWNKVFVEQENDSLLQVILDELYSRDTWID